MVPPVFLLRSFAMPARFDYVSDARRVGRSDAGSNCLTGFSPVTN